MIIKANREIIKGYFEDESGLRGGYADRVIFPESESDAVDILAEASAKKQPLTISGGGTGVTGARIPFGGSILATDSLNKIIDIDQKNLFATVQPGVRLSDLQTELSRSGLVYPPDPTEPNSFIGGTISTNASGAKGFKYGSTRNYIKRLKVALPTGNILNIKRGEFFLTRGKHFKLKLKNKELEVYLPGYSVPDIKSSAGYYIKDNMDLIELFIGHEGTLGLILEADVRIDKKPEDTISFFSFFSSEQDALNFVEDARPKVPLCLEYMDAHSLHLLRQKYSYIPETATAMIYFEQDCKKQEEDKLIDLWMKLLETHNALMEQCFFANSEKEAERLRELRHALPEMINEIVRKNKFPKVGTDIAVPGQNFNRMYKFYKEKLSSLNIDFVIFGHIGENHLHVNILPKTNEELANARTVYMDFVKMAVSLGGTISAEHGIGKLKHAYLETMYGKKALKEMAWLKKSFDPACILCLDNIFPKELLI